MKVTGAGPFMSEHTRRRFLASLAFATVAGIGEARHTMAPPHRRSWVPTVPAAASEVNVKDFGAAGNGATDDTAAIHAARDAAGVGGTVVVPPGTYMVKGVNWTTIGGDLQLAGLLLNQASQTWHIMPGATIVHKNNGVATVTGVGTTSTQNLTGIIVVSAPGVTINGGGTVNGNRASVGDLPWNNLAVIFGTVDSNDLTVENIYVTEAPRYGIWGHGSHTRVLNCRFYRNAFSSVMLASYQPTPSWPVHDTYNNEINGCHVDCTSEDPATFNHAALNIRNGWAGKPWTTSTAWLLNQICTNGGNLYKCTTVGTSAASGSGPSGVGSAIADGTAVWNYVSAGQNYTGSYGKIINNYVIIPSGCANTDGNACGITNMTLGGLTSGNTVINGVIGISIVRADNSQVVDNTVIGGTLAAIEIAVSPGAIVRGNTINGQGTLGSAPSGCGIWLNGSFDQYTSLSNDVSIIGNRIFGMNNLGRPISTGYVSRLTVIGNSITGRYGVALNTVSDVTVSNNVFLGDGVGAGVSLVNSNSVLVSVNDIRNYANGVTISATSATVDNINISNNLFRQCAVSIGETKAGSGTVGSNIINSGNIVSAT
jgi:hypothetical protein